MNLKPCPFCGSKKLGIARTNANACWVTCELCGASADSNPSRNIAIRIWNHRSKAKGSAKIVWDQDLDNEMYQKNN